MCMSLNSIALNCIHRYTYRGLLHCYTYNDIRWGNKSAEGYNSVDKKKKQHILLYGILNKRFKNMERSKECYYSRTSGLTTHPHLHFKC